MKILLIFMLSFSIYALDKIEVAESGIHKVDFLVNRGKIPKSFNIKLRELSIETIVEYKQRVPEEQWVDIPNTATDDAFIIIATQDASLNGATPILHMFYKANGKYIRNKEVLINENDNDNEISVWPEGVNARDLTETGLHLFTEDQEMKKVYPGFAENFFKAVLEKKTNDQTASVKLFSTHSTDKYISVIGDMNLKVVSHSLEIQ